MFHASSEPGPKFTRSRHSESFCLRSRRDWLTFKPVDAKVIGKDQVDLSRVTRKPFARYLWVQLESKRLSRECGVDPQMFGAASLSCVPLTGLAPLRTSKVDNSLEFGKQGNWSQRCLCYPLFSGWCLQCFRHGPYFQCRQYFECVGHATAVADLH